MGRGVGRRYPQGDDTWMVEAACVGADPELFFPNQGGGGKAKRVCAGCQVKAECLAFSLTVPYARELGVWGGLTPRERRGLRRR